MLGCVSLYIYVRNLESRAPLFEIWVSLREGPDSTLRVQRTLPHPAPFLILACPPLNSPLAQEFSLVDRTASPADRPANMKIPKVR
jgi:hypothetical protein